MFLITFGEFYFRSYWSVLTLWSGSMNLLKHNAGMIIVVYVGYQLKKAPELLRTPGFSLVELTSVVENVLSEMCRHS